MAEWRGGGGRREEEGGVGEVVLAAEAATDRVHWCKHQKTVVGGTELLRGVGGVVR